MKRDMDNLISLDDVLVKFNKENKKFINEIDKQENEDVETLDVIENEIKGVKINTALKKSQFISELKSGLGVEVMKNPGKVIIIKKSLGTKVKEFFKAIFTKF